MKIKELFIIILIISCFIVGCKNKTNEMQTKNNTTSWKATFDDKLTEFGHRNWILIVDKAFPSQTAAGIITINTNEELLSVLKYTMKQIDNSTHVKPIVYTDKELNFITKDQVPEIENFRCSLSEVIGQLTPQVLLHDSVFVKIDKATKLFNVMILKTSQTIPYSSVFIQLDCKYWSIDKEIQLRKNISTGLK